MRSRFRRWLATPVQPWVFGVSRKSSLGPFSLGLLTAVILVPITIWAGTPLITPLVTAYTVGITAYLVVRQEVELSNLVPILEREPAVSKIVRMSLRRHPRGLLLIGWVLGLVAMVVVNLTSDSMTALMAGVKPQAAQLWGLFAAALFWGLFCEMLVAFSRNALTFHRLGAKHVTIDLLDVSSLTPFARVAIRNFLIFVGGLALAPLQLLESAEYLPQITTGVLIVAPCCAILVALPIWGVHLRLAESKALELRRVRDALRGVPGALDESPIAADAATMSITSLVMYREMIRGISEWPVDAPAVARFAAYIVIPVMAWVGAALVERWMDLLL